jgi:hypothetical protein
MYYYAGSQLCSEINLMSIRKDAGNFFIAFESKSKAGRGLFSSKSVFEGRHERKYIIKADLNLLSYTFLAIMKYEHIDFIIDSSIFRRSLIGLESNSWIAKPISHTMNVSFCIISLKTLPNDLLQLGNSLANLEKQTYKNWKAIYFSEELSER